MCKDPRVIVRLEFFEPRATTSVCRVSDQIHAREGAGRPNTSSKGGVVVEERRVVDGATGLHECAAPCNGEQAMKERSRFEMHECGKAEFHKPTLSVASPRLLLATWSRLTLDALSAFDPLLFSEYQAACRVHRSTGSGSTMVSYYGLTAHVHSLSRINVEEASAGGRVAIKYRLDESVVVVRVDLRLSSSGRAFRFQSRSRKKHPLRYRHHSG